MKELSVKELARRLGHLVASLFILLCVTFVIGRVLPADPVGAIVGELADPAAYAAMREKLGLDLPIYQQFFIYLNGLAHGDFGTAVLTGNPVSADLAQAFPATFELATLAVMISTFVGVPLGLDGGALSGHFHRQDRPCRGPGRPFHSGILVRIVGLVIFYAGLNWVGGPGTVDVFYEGMVTPQTGLLLVDSLLQGETEIFWNALSTSFFRPSSWPMRPWPTSPA
jgi:peptide/nickel transport system permease protein